MNLLNIIRGFDGELYDYFEKELERQFYSLSFIPDENSISPLCSSTLGSVMINAQPLSAFAQHKSLERLVMERICQLFDGEHANVKTISIEDASRVVFQALLQRGDVVMSLDLRKQEHCNSESLAYRFVNFGLDPATQKLNMDIIEEQVKATKPKMLIVSPINYPLPIDYERFALIAHEVGAILWCDVSQIAGLVTAKALPSPLPYADIMTFTAQGALQGPRSSVIICKNKYASAIDRSSVAFGHSGLGASELAALCVHIREMQTEEYKNYCHNVILNAEALAKGLTEGGMKLVCGGTNSHFVIIDAKHCGLSARGALEILADCGIMVRYCQVLTSDPDVKFDAVRLSTLPVTTRGMTIEQSYKIGLGIGKFLSNPNKDNEHMLQSLVREVAVMLPQYHDRWLCDVVRDNLERNNIYLGSSDSSVSTADRSRFSKLVRGAGKILHPHGEVDGNPNANE